VTKTALAKALLKVGLKAAAPFFSDIVLTAVDQGANLIIDERAAATVATRDRLLSRIENDIVQVDRHEGAAPDSLGWVIPTLTDLLNEHPVTPEEWAAANFDSARLSETILSAALPKLKTLSNDEKNLFARTVRNYFSMLAEERDTIKVLEGEFRNAVMNSLAAMPVNVAAQFAKDAAIQKQAVAAALLSTQRRLWRPGLSSPAALLRADIQNPVPFHGRESDLRSLEDWCERSDSLLVRLYTGAGGMGKSRLLLETCNHQLAKGWRAGFLDSRSKTASREIIGALFGDDNSFIVVDYAETRRSELHPLLSEAYAAHGRGRIRIVLLARSASDWWEALAAEGNGVGEIVSGPAAEWTPLRPLAEGPAARESSYKIARDHFAARLVRSGDQNLPDDLEDDIYGLTLMLHMRALVAIEGVKVKGDQGVLDYILDRERRYWRQRANELGVPEVLTASIGQAAALVTLNGGARTSSDALAIFKSLARLADQPAAMLATFSDMLHGLYPGDHWIEPVQPDLLGEHLVQKEIERAPDELLGLAFGAAAGDKCA
jgi:hypothetical protein